MSFQGEDLNEEAIVAAMKTDTALSLKADDVILKVYPRHFSPTEVEKLLGDPSKVRHGWAGDHSPANCFRNNYMVMEQVKKSSLLNMHGFPSPICFV
jgi:GDPmannose 4,6-dehydratase